MTYWVTTIRAIDPLTGELTTFFGPYVPGITKEDAKQYCQTNGLGYCKVGDQLVAEIDDHGVSFDMETINSN